MGLKFINDMLPKIVLGRHRLQWQLMGQYQNQQHR